MMEETNLLDGMEQYLMGIETEDKVAENGSPETTKPHKARARAQAQKGKTADGARYATIGIHEDTVRKLKILKLAYRKVKGETFNYQDFFARAVDREISKDPDVKKAFDILAEVL